MFLSCIADDDWETIVGHSKNRFMMPLHTIFQRIVGSKLAMTVSSGNVVLDGHEEQYFLGGHERIGFPYMELAKGNWEFFISTVQRHYTAGNWDWLSSCVTA